MAYKKPTLLVSPALEAVKGTGSKLDDVQDNLQPPMFTTTPAYEADE